MNEIRVDSKYDLNNKLMLHKQYMVAFWITLCISIVLIIGGFFVPPLGSIDGSILTAIGELFLWPALAFGAKALSEGKKAKFKKGDTTLEVGELDRGGSEDSEGREYSEGRESGESGEDID